MATYAPMNDFQYPSTSQSPTSLAEIDAAIFQLESQRAAILRYQLQDAEARIAGLSSSASAEQPTHQRSGVAKKKSAAKKGAGAAPGARKKGGRRSSIDQDDRLARLSAVIKGAGKEGISAKKASEKTGIPYPATRAILAESGIFRREGEKRDSRFFLS